MITPGGVSSPARGTWIEMPLVETVVLNCSVVPRKGDVDRNGSRWLTYHYPFWSSPARGTWIEI